MDLRVLLSQMLQAAIERICDLKVLIVAIPAGSGVVEGRLHLVYSCDNLLGFIDHFLLLGSHYPHLAVESFRQSLEELHQDRIH